MVILMVIKIKKVTVIIFLCCLCCIFLVSMFSKNEATAIVSIKKDLRLPIVMYHQISSNKNNLGKYVLSVEQFENDLKYIKEKGYTCITVEELIDYVEGKTTLGEKVIMLTFDDGYESAYTKVYPLLKKYNMKAVISVVGYLADLYTEINDHNDYYSYLNWEEIEFLSETPEIEIQNHSYDMHYCEKGKRKGMGKLKGESYEAYSAALNEDVGKMQMLIMKKGGCIATAMAYPFGEYNKDTLEICKKLGFKSTFTCEERVNTITRFNTGSLYNLGRYNRPSGISSEKFFIDLLDS